MTANVSCGAMELDEAGEFQELRTMGVKLTRHSPKSLELVTTTGLRLFIESPERIDVTTTDAGH